MNLRKTRLTGIIIFLVVGTILCSIGYFVYRQHSKGNVEQAQFLIETTEQYSEEDILAACSIVKEAFNGYKWCTLYQLRYNDSECLSIAKSYAHYHSIEIENVIVLRGDFISGKTGMRQPYILPNMPYDNFIWVLTREKHDAQWKVSDAY